MEINVQLFGPQAALAGVRELTVGVAGEAATARQVLDALGAAAPELVESLAASRLAVNHEFADERRRVGPSDEVALIGMVSGG